MSGFQVVPKGMSRSGNRCIGVIFSSNLFGISKVLKLFESCRSNAGSDYKCHKV